MPTSQVSSANSRSEDTSTTSIESNEMSSSKSNTSRTGKTKPSYKHVPHSQKPAHLVAKRNARERRRVQAVNQAFYRLRKCVPIENRNKRVSKVKTLQRAIDYIRKLERILAEDDEANGTNQPVISMADSQSLAANESSNLHLLINEDQHVAAKTNNCDMTANHRRSATATAISKRPETANKKRGRKPNPKVPIEEPIVTSSNLELQHHHQYQQQQQQQPQITSAKYVTSQQQAGAIYQQVHNHNQMYMVQCNSQQPTSAYHPEVGVLRESSACNRTSSAGMQGHQYQQYHQPALDYQPTTGYMNGINYSGEYLSTCDEQVPNFLSTAATTATAKITNNSSSDIPNAYQSNGGHPQQIVFYPHQSAASYTCSDHHQPAAYPMQHLQQETDQRQQHHNPQWRPATSNVHPLGTPSAQTKHQQPVDLQSISQLDSSSQVNTATRGDNSSTVVCRPVRADRSSAINTATTLTSSDSPPTTINGRSSQLLRQQQQQQQQVNSGYSAYAPPHLSSVGPAPASSSFAVANSSTEADDTVAVAYLHSSNSLMAPTRTDGIANSASSSIVSKLNNDSAAQETRTSHQHNHHNHHHHHHHQVRHLLDGVASPASISSANNNLHEQRQYHHHNQSSSSSASSSSASSSSVLEVGAAIFEAK